jgi:hypothetical protein
VVTPVVIVGDRLYLHLLIADQGGDQVLEHLIRHLPDTPASSPGLPI